MRNRLQYFQKSINSFIPHFLGVISNDTRFSHKTFFGNNLSTHFLSLIGNRRKYKMSNIRSFITHFLKLLTIGHKLFYRRISINSFLTYISDTYNFCMSSESYIDEEHTKLQTATF